jgi:hypothetical protein
MPQLSDEIYDKQLEQLRQMDPATIRQLLLLSEKFKVYYDRLEQMLGNRGLAKYVVISLVITLVIVLGLIFWRVFGFLWSYVAGIAGYGGSSIDTSDTTTTTTAASSVTPENVQNANSLESEFEF